MQRKITSHQVNGGKLNEALQIITLDEPGPAGANCSYRILGLRAGRGGPSGSVQMPPIDIRFHTGDPVEGIFGLSNEALLAIALDRLEGFQRGSHPHPANKAAAIAVQRALDALQIRTMERIERGVEGTTQQ